MARGPLIPGIREYDAPRRKRAPTFWVWTIGGIVVVVALVVVGGIVAGIGPLRALGSSETPLEPVAWRPTDDPRVIQIAVTLPESGMCSGDEIVARAIERPTLIEVSAVKAAPRGEAACGGIGIAGDRTWVDLTLDEDMGSRSAVRTSDRMPLPEETGDNPTSSLPAG